MPMIPSWAAQDMWFMFYSVKCHGATQHAMQWHPFHHGAVVAVTQSDLALHERIPHLVEGQGQGHGPGRGLSALLLSIILPNG